MINQDDIKFLTTLKPEQIIKFFNSKGLKTSWDWNEVWQESHFKSFTVAKAMTVDILSGIKDELNNSLRNGLTLEQFKKNLKPLLKEKGWWGRVPAKDVPGYIPRPDLDPEKEVTLGSPRRLETIYRTNMRTSYSTGRFNTQMDQSEERPYWQYIQLERPNKRYLHSLLHLKVYRFDDPIWNIIYPPNGWGCECRVRNLSDKNMKTAKLKVSVPPPVDSLNIDPEWQYNPADFITPFLSNKINGLKIKELFNDFTNDVILSNTAMTSYSNWINKVTDKKSFKKDSRIVGVLNNYLKDILVEKGIVPEQSEFNRTIQLIDKQIIHSLRTVHVQKNNTLSPDEVKLIPKMIAYPMAVYFDKINKNFLFAAKPLDKNDKRLIKIVVSPNSRYKTNTLKDMNANFILTFFKTNENDLNESRYEYVYGNKK